MLLLSGLLSCNNQSEDVESLQHQIDSLEIKLSEVYKPGFGEMMNSIQLHHLKHWYAEKNRNWKLAEVEIKEPKEVTDEIEKF